FEVNDEDGDSAHNAGPFTFEIRSGNKKSLFRITDDGELRTAARFQRSEKGDDSYNLQIRVYDNGHPPLFSEAWIEIRIVNGSQYSPVIKPLTITALVPFNDDSGYFLGTVE
ncbi:unnamed protein product, partial [Meganyctiphanes norvegica]